MTRLNGLSGWRVGRRLSVLSVVAALAVTAGRPHAGGQEETPIQEPTAAPTMTLVDRTPWVGIGDRFVVTVHAPEASSVEATVHEEVVAAGGRSRFRSQIEGASLGVQLGESRTAAPRGNGRWSVEIPVGGAGEGQSASEPPEPGNDPVPVLDLPSDGVYPVDLRAFDADGIEIARLVTHLVNTTGSGSFPPIRTALVIDGPQHTATTADGQAELAPSDRLGVQAVTRAVLGELGVPFVYDITPESIDALGTLDRSRLSRSAARVPVAPWADLDLGAWMNDPALADELDHQVRRGAGTLAGSGIDTTPSIVIDQPLTARERRTIADERSGAFVTSTDLAVDLPAPEVGRLAPLTLDGTELPALIVDDRLQSHLRYADRDPMLSIHRVLAEIAVLFFDRPNDARTLMLWIDEPRIVGPDALESLLGALDGSGPAEATAPVVALESVPSEGVLTIERRPPPGLGDYAAELQETVRRIRTWGSILDPEDDRADEYVRTLDATAAADTIGEADQWFARMRAMVESELRGISVPQRQTITLTERDADLPIRIDNDLGYEANVTLELESTRLEFLGSHADGSISVHLEDGRNDLAIPVRARSAGSFPLEVRVGTPDGLRRLASARFSVRSTALNGVGIALTAGSLLVLLVWWVRNFRDGRRDRRLIERADHPSRHE